jgi:hypothetical protein
VVLYGSQNSVGSAAVGGGNQIRERVLRVRGFMGKHGGCRGLLWLVCEGADGDADGCEGGERVLALTNAVAVKGRLECSRAGVVGCGCADRRDDVVVRERKTRLPTGDRRARCVRESNSGRRPIL